MTLDELEKELKTCRDLGAKGCEPIYLTGSVMTGIDGLKISTVTLARHAGLCEPAAMDVGQIIRIWGVPEGNVSN